MLKIVNNVDLKELEKYGFRFDEDKTCYNREIDGNWWDTININIEDKIIYRATDVVGYSEIDYEIDEYIDDLIKADLVENVGE